MFPLRARFLKPLIPLSNRCRALAAVALKLAREGSDAIQIAAHEMVPAALVRGKAKVSRHVGASRTGAAEVNQRRQILLLCLCRAASTLGGE